MKKLILLSISLMLFIGSTYAADRKHIKREQLPKAALKYVQENWNGTSIRHTTMITEGSMITYEVSLVDNTVILFNRDGALRNVKAAADGEISESAIPWGVRYYVKQNHRNHKVVAIEKHLDGYTVTLDNGKTVDCDLNGNVK